MGLLESAMKIPFEELTIYEVEQFHQALLNELDTDDNSSNSLILDFSQVKKIDLNTIQLILSLKKTCDEKSIEFQLSNIVARQVKQTFKLFNLEQQLSFKL